MQASAEVRYLYNFINLYRTVYTKENKKKVFNFSFLKLWSVYITFPVFEISGGVFQGITLCAEGIRLHNVYIF